MSYVISTSVGVVASLREPINSACVTFRVNENSRNSKVSNIKVTRGFCFINDVSVESQRAKNPALTVVNATEIESGRIQAIHDHFCKQDTQNTC